MRAEAPMLAAVRTIVDRIAGAHRAPADAGADTRLAEDYWLDSVELLEVVLACEAEFEVAFDERSDFDAAALATLGTLAELVQSKQLKQGVR